MGRYWREPKTANEMRKYYDAEEQGIRVRAKRHPCYLPTLWDDKYRGRQRCWKVQRSRQWR